MAGTKISQLTEDAIVAGDTVAIRRGASNYAGTIGDQIAAIETITAQLQTTGTAAAFSINTDSDNNATGATADLLFDNNGGTTVARLRWDEATSTFNLGYGANNHLSINSSGNIEASGSLGVGETPVSGYVGNFRSSSDAILGLSCGDANYCELRFGDTADRSRGSIQYTSGDELVFLRGNMAESMRLTSTGLGIGTAPENPLDLWGSTGSTFLAVRDDRSNPSDLAGIKFSTKGGTAFDSYKSFIAHIETGSNGQGDLIFAVDPDSAAGNATVSDEILRLSANTNVSIGYGLAPTNKLTIKHDEAVNTWSSVSDASTDAVVKILGSNNATPYGLYMGYANSANNAQGIQAGDGTSALPLTLNPKGGAIMMEALPTSDPTNAGEIWNDSGTLKVSAG